MCAGVREKGVCAREGVNEGESDDRVYEGVYAGVYESEEVTTVICTPAHPPLDAL